MPKISQKGYDMPASPIRKLTPYAESAKQKGKKVYHLNIGQPDIETPKGMIDAIKNIDFKVWAYTPSEGILSYRNKLAQHYNRINYNITASDILVTNGASEAITIAMQTCLNSGDEIIIPEPFYANYSGFACMANITVKPLLSVMNDNFALPSISEFEKVITEHTKAIFICNPNNPTGYLYSKEELELLRDLCLKYDLFLFSDEAYREFCYDGREFISPLNLSGFDDHVVIIDSVSKRYSACGARLGCMITKNKAVYKAALKFAQARLSAPLVAQIAGEAALDTPDSYFIEVKKEYTQRRDLLANGLNKIPGVRCSVPGGAFYIVAELPVDDTEKFCQWMLEEFDYQNETVMMAPASGFYSTPGIGKNEVRLAYVINQEDLRRALTCIEKGLVAYNSSVKEQELSKQTN